MAIQETVWQKTAVNLLNSQFHFQLCDQLQTPYMACSANLKSIEGKTIPLQPYSDFNIPARRHGAISAALSLYIAAACLSVM